MRSRSPRGKPCTSGARQPCGPDITYELDSPSGQLASGFARRVCDDIGRFDVVENGIHTLRVVSQGAATGSYSFTVTPIRADGGAPLAVGGAATGTIDAPGARDTYPIELMAGEIVYVESRGACGAALKYQLYSPSDAYLFGHDYSPCEGDAGRP